MNRIFKGSIGRSFFRTVTGKQIAFFCLCIAFLFCGLLLPVGNALAETEQQTVARNFLKYLHSSKRIVSVEQLKADGTPPLLSSVAVADLFRLEGGGYIVVPLSKDLAPVKLYSLTNNFDALPPPFKTFLLAELEAGLKGSGLNSAGANSGGQTADFVRIPSSVEDMKRWDFLLSYEAAKSPLAYVPDTFLVTTKWNQDYPYNKYLPTISGKSVVAGCVAVAISQVLRYHAYPSAGRGVVSYTWNSGLLKSILYRPYNWANMPDAYDTLVPDYKADEVALLIKDIAVASQTGFGVSSSGATFVPGIQTLVENYGYSNTLGKMSNSDAAAFFAKIKTEIDASRPMLIEFPGHMAVADGYASDGTGKKIHINMGWGDIIDPSTIKETNTFYSLDGPVSPLSSIFDPNPPGNFSIYYNIKPCTAGVDCSPNLESGDSIAGFNITGKFDYPNDADTYGVYLKGQTTASGSRGYSEQAFFISIFNSSNVLVASGDNYTHGSLNINLPAGRYHLMVSLCDMTSSLCYTLADKINYTASISTTALTPSEKSAVDAALDIPPVIFNNLEDMVLNASGPAYKILIDARDENGDPLTLAVAGTNSLATDLSLSGNILTITPKGISGVSDKITVSATAGGKTVQKSFVVMLSGTDVGFGKTFSVSGMFANPNDYYEHKVILDGSCSIKGFNGYTNQAFFSSVKDTGGSTIVAPTDVAINRTFSRGVYLLGASICTGGACYCPADPTQPCPVPGHDKYYFDVSCPSAVETTATIAGLLGIDLSGTLPPPVITVTDNVAPAGDHSIPFGNVDVNSTLDKTVTVSNTAAGGSRGLVIGTIAGTDALTAPFSLQSDNCSGHTLAPSSSCSFNVRFAPVAAGPFLDTFNIPSADPVTPSVVFSVSGTGLSASPQIKVSGVLLKENFSSGIPAAWTNVDAWTTDNTVCPRTLAAPFAAPWAIVDSGCGTTTTETLTTAAFSAKDCTTADISFTSKTLWNGGNGAVGVSADGGTTWVNKLALNTNEGPVWKTGAINEIAGSANSKVRFVYTGSAAGAYWAIDNIWIGCRPAALKFTASDQQHTVLVENTGKQNLVIGATGISGADSANFTIPALADGCSGSTLLPGDSCAMDVKFSSLVPGVKTGILNIPSNDPAAPTASVALNGSTVAIGDVDGSGTMNIVDALFVARHAAGLSVAVFYAFAADVNCDGTVNIVDALFIARKAAGLTVTGWCGP